MRETKTHRWHDLFQNPIWKLLPQECRWQPSDLGLEIKTISQGTFNEDLTCVRQAMSSVLRNHRGDFIPMTLCRPGRLHAVDAQLSSTKWQIIMVEKEL